MALDDNVILFRTLTADGGSGTATTKLILTFSKAIAGLDRSNISYSTQDTDVTIATGDLRLGSTAGVYELDVTGISADGEVTLTVYNEHLAPATRTVHVYGGPLLTAASVRWFRAPTEGKTPPISTSLRPGAATYEVFIINWDCATDTFEYGERYTATITLKAKPGYQFTSSFTPQNRWADTTVSFVNVSADEQGNRYTFTVAFPPAPRPATAVSVYPATLTLAPGGAYTLTATIEPDDATNQSVRWSSSDTGIVTVNASGEITAIAAGEAVITATTADDDGWTAECAVTVGVPVTGITINKSALTLALGGSETLTVIVTPDDATNPAVIWSSSDDTIATVDESGRVTAIAAG
jgi:hypothetical protein